MQVQGIPQPGEAEQRALGRALLELRARRGLSQEALAAGAGTHRNYVGQLERGEVSPTFRTLLRMAAGLRLKLSDVIEVYERQLAYEREPRWD